MMLIGGIKILIKKTTDGLLHQTPNSTITFHIDKGIGVGCSETKKTYLTWKQKHTIEKYLRATT